MTTPTTAAGRRLAAKYRALIESAWFEEPGSPVDVDGDVAAIEAAALADAAAKVRALHAEHKKQATLPGFDLAPDSMCAVCRGYAAVLLTLAIEPPK